MCAEMSQMKLFVIMNLIHTSKLLYVSWEYIMERNDLPYISID